MLKVTNQVNLARLLRPFADKWVALSPDKKRVVADGHTLRETERKIDPKNIEEVIFMKAPSFTKLFVPYVL